MPDNAEVKMQPTLGLTGLTMNAMALIAPGAFLWLTFYIQATTGVTAPSMWMGIVLALVLCLATAVCYAELAKLYPGTGSSYYFAEQAFLNHDKAWRYARLSKFIVGWGSHLYYWIYPNFMINVYEGVIDTNLVLPVAPDACLVQFDFFFADVSEGRRAYNAESVAVSDRVQAEDVDICESVQRGLGSRAYGAGRLSVRREAGEHLFHRLLAKDLRSQSSTEFFHAVR